MESLVNLRSPLRRVEVPRSRVRGVVDPRDREVGQRPNDRFCYGGNCRRNRLVNIITYEIQDFLARRKFPARPSP